MTIGENDLVSFSDVPPCISGVHRNFEDAAMKFLDRMYLGRGAMGRVVLFGQKPAPRTQPWHHKFREFDSGIQNMIMNEHPTRGRWHGRLIFVDRFTQFMNLGNPRNLYAADGIHLSSQGYAWMGDALRQAIYEVRQTDYFSGDLAGKSPGRSREASRHAQGSVPHHAGAEEPTYVHTDAEGLQDTNTNLANYTDGVLALNLTDDMRAFNLTDEILTFEFTEAELEKMRARKLEIEKMDEAAEEEIEDLPNAVEPGPLDYNGMTILQKLEAHERYLALKK